jgi:hypothetical protein
LVGWLVILRIGWFCDFGKKPSERDAFDILIFLQKKSKYQKHLSPPHPFSSRTVAWRNPKTILRKV